MTDLARNGELVRMPRSPHMILGTLGFRIGTDFQPRYGTERREPLEPVYVKQVGQTAAVIVGTWAATGRSPRIDDACALHVWHWPGSGRQQRILELNFSSLRELISHLPAMEAERA